VGVAVIDDGGDVIMMTRRCDSERVYYKTGQIRSRYIQSVIAVSCGEACCSQERGRLYFCLQVQDHSNAAEPIDSAVLAPNPDGLPSTIMDDSIPSISTGSVGSRFVSSNDIETAKARRDEQWKAAYARQACCGVIKRQA
jgi:hypothetical protein